MGKGPFKMKGSPMKRNFGISPLKQDKPGVVKPKKKINIKGVLDVASRTPNIIAAAGSAIGSLVTKGKTKKKLQKFEKKQLSKAYDVEHDL